jgi:hypothetical protein
VVGKWVGEVVGINEHCFEVMGRRGTHRSGCSMVLAVGWRGAPARGWPVVVGGRVRGQGGGRSTDGAREGGGEAGGPDWPGDGKPMEVEEEDGIQLELVIMEAAEGVIEACRDGGMLGNQSSGLGDDRRRLASVRSSWQKKKAAGSMWGGSEVLPYFLSHLVFKAKTGYSSHVCLGSRFHTNGQNYSISDKTSVIIRLRLLQ